MKKKILWILSIILLVLLAIGLLLKYDLQQKRTVDGIDISHHNVVRDWNKVKVGFIYAKATEGKSHRDTKFVRFRRNAMKRGIPFGAYHFLSTDVSAKQQFQNFKNVVPKGSTTLIPMLDIEGELPIPDDSLKTLVGGWIEECHDYYGYYPLLYLSPYSLYLRLMGTPNLSKCQLWSGITTPHWDIIPFYTARIVQFKIDKMDGFEGGIDCNHLNGSLDDLRMKE
jgi:lysozyme